MFLAKVITPVVCSVIHPAFSGKPLFLIERIEPDGSGEAEGDYHLAVDYVGAGPGDTVIAGGPPGLGESLGLPRAPISTWVMAIAERAEKST
ncbi:MAG: EutN/CcmL family microcompartment protein [Firmicutes bacterium]|jgi:microcompartment protein CcmK/EutM|nr:EutN/CcmL family microcompartment protein [Bacillota bacterium]